MKTLHVKVSDESMERINDYKEKISAKNLDDAADAFIKSARFDSEED